MADLTIVDAEDVSKPFQLSYNFELEDEPIRIGDEIIIRPILLKKWKNNPFPNKQRYYPVDFPIKQSYTLAFNVKVPDNYEIKEVPKSRAISLPDKGGRYLFNVSQLGNQISIMVRLNLTKQFYSVSDYDYLMNLFDKVLEDQESLITIKEGVSNERLLF